jgi:transcriptional regulator with XRE-family HTH domain
MSRSTKKSTLAVLREIMGITAGQMGKRLDCSRHTINSIEINRIALGEERATKLLTQTHISPDWLLANDPKAPPVSAKGEPYTREIYDGAQAFERARAESGRGFFHQGHWYFRLTNEIGFCAQLVAILKSASAQKKYFMAAYKVGKALDSLRNEFEQNSQIYPVTYSKFVIDPRALEILDQLVDRGQKEVDKFNQRLIRARRKRSSSQQRKKKWA